MTLPGGEGSVYNTCHKLYFDFFGLAGICLPFIVLFFGITEALNKTLTKYYIKSFEILVGAFLISGIISVTHVSFDGSTLGESVSELFAVHGGVNYGGLFGVLSGGGLYSLTESIPVCVIILILLLIIDVMLLFGITFFNLLMKIEIPAKKVGEYTEEQIEKRKVDYDNFKTERAKCKEERQQQKSIRKTDPTVVVNDFYKKSNKKDRSENAPASAQTEQEKPKQFSLFKQDYSSIPIFAEFAEKAKSGTSKNEKNNPVSDSVAYDRVGDDVIVETIDPVTAKKEEKVDPLTKEEAEAISAELNDALGEITEEIYEKPPLDCLNLPKNNVKNFNENELKSNGDKLIAALHSFNVSASIVDVVPGPTVTRYELSPAPGVKISKFVGLSDDLALHMAAPAGLRIEAPIPNKAAIGIEIPNRNKTTVTFREIIDTEQFRNAKSKLNVALGKNISGDPVYSDLAKMPHLLVAGTTGSGKSVCLNTMIVSLLFNATPDEVKILLIDPKQVEFGVYNGLPHLLVPVVSDPRKASGALGWAVTEMLSRYKTLNANGVRDISAYNSLCEERDDLAKMPQIVIFIDELSDLMTVAPAEVEDSIQRLAQMARAAGMHLVVATQRPSVDVITGVIKANIPSRIALTVKSQIDSRTIIDSAGAEKLMGNGDMLYYPVGVPKPIRVQGSYLTDSEIENVVSFIKSNGSAQYDDDVQKEIDKQAAQEKKKSGDEEGGSGIDSGDDLLMRAIELFVGTPEKASISALQRHLGLGFAKAGRLMDTLEEKGIVGPHEGSKPRKVLITKAQWYEMNALSDTAAEAGTEGTPDDIPVISDEFNG